MSYLLHIRRESPSGGQLLSRDDWAAYVAHSTAFSPAIDLGNDYAVFSMSNGDPNWIRWVDGELEFPHREGLDLQFAHDIAAQWGGVVVGEEQEIYTPDGDVIRPGRDLGLSRALGRIRSLLFRRRDPPDTDFSFAVGDRVEDLLGRECVIVAIDPSADHGLGRVEVRYSDSRQLSFSISASGLRRRVDE